MTPCAHEYAQIYTNMYTQSHTCTHTFIIMHAHAHTHAHNHSYMYNHARSRTHTHTHTHIVPGADTLESSCVVTKNELSLLPVQDVSWPRSVLSSSPLSVLHRNSSTSFPPTAAILPSLDMLMMAGGA
jgi:hypothetical protein